MAIIPSIPGLTVTIMVDGVPAVEYDPNAGQQLAIPLSSELDLLSTGDQTQQDLPYVVKYKFSHLELSREQILREQILKERTLGYIIF